MTLAAALTQIKTWTPTGVTTNYGIDLPDGQLYDKDLPALWCDLAFSSHTSGIVPASVDYTVGGATIFVQHRLAVIGVGASLPGMQADMITLIDAYLDAVNADWRLDDNLVEPLRILRVDPSPIPFRGLLYFGISFLHEWRLRVA